MKNNRLIEMRLPEFAKEFKTKEEFKNYVRSYVALVEPHYDVVKIKGLTAYIRRKDF